MTICSLVDNPSSGIIDPRIFDSLIPYIQKMDSNGKIEMTVPPHLNLDFDSMKTYFKEDTALFCERGKPSFIKGTLKDPNVTNYLMNKFKALR